MATKTTPTEAQVRAMRDQVYGKPSTDHNWAMCRENWLRPDSIAWLQARTQSQQP